MMTEISWNNLDSIKEYVNQQYPEHVTVLITGANCGIGYNTAVYLAKVGCHLIITCRSVQKCIETCARITEETGNSNISYVDLELSSYDSIDSFVSKYLLLNEQVDVLVNNAGISMVTQYTQSQYNQELNFQINYLSTIRFTEQFLPQLKKSPHPVLCFTTSLSINDVRVKEMNDNFMHMDENNYGWYKAYAQSKFCLTAYAMKLASIEPELFVTLMDPGVVATNIARNTCLSSAFTSFIGKFFFPMEKALYNALFCILNREHHTHECHIYRNRTLVSFPKLLQNQEFVDYIYNYTQQLIHA